MTAGRTPGVTVFGPPSITRQLVALLLGSSGGTALALDDASAEVIVLVDPEGEHWREATATGRSVVLVTSESLDDDGVAAAVLMGADAVLTVDSGATALFEAIDVVSSGAIALRPDQLRRVVVQARQLLDQRVDTAEPARLSQREVEILHSIAQGHSVKQTALALGIRPKTVENVQSRLFRKLGVRNRAEAVRRAFELGMIAE